MNKKGTLYFFTGLSGAGKTTIGGLFYRRLRARNPLATLFDGDQIRTVFGNSGYSTEERLRAARRGFPLYRVLTDQGLSVVCCSIAMYDEIRNWNRAHIENYQEVYIRVKMETLYRRDQKGLYTSGAKQVVGVDLPYDEPKRPDFIIENNGEESPEEIVSRIEAALFPADGGADGGPGTSSDGRFPAGSAAGGPSPAKAAGVLSPVEAAGVLSPVEAAVRTGAVAPEDAGTLYFLTGPASARKEAVGGLLADALRERRNGAAMLLTDTSLRPCFEIPLDTAENRLRLAAEHELPLCRLMTGQGMDVVLCSETMSAEARTWAEAHIAKFRETAVPEAGTPEDAARELEARFFPEGKG